MRCANGQVDIRTGDCRDLLRAMPDQSVNCIVTSPPYFGLRDYGVGGQIGLEQTPQGFVAEMVAVFREARRVLRDDGTCWVNLGITYASRDMHPNQFHQPAHGPAYDSDGTEPLGSQETGSVCRDQCDEPQDGFQTHHGRISGNDRLDHEGALQTCTTDRDNEHPGSVSASPDASPRGVLASTTRASFWRDRAACVPSGAASASLPVEQTFDGDAQASAHTEPNNSRITSPSGSSGADTAGTVSSGSALSCSCGSCGICWANIAIPMMNIKAKDEINVPHLVAMALQADGWFLRQTIVWAKPNPMPESVRDRCTKAHEYLFMLTKSARYWYDADAIREAMAESSVARLSQNVEAQNGSDRVPGKTNGPMKAVARKTDKQRGHGRRHAGFNDRWDAMSKDEQQAVGRNKRSVWTVATQPYSEAHFATYPPALIEPCILAGCPKGGAVLDPFGGAGTTGLVAARHGRKAILCELNPTYAEMAHKRISREWRETVKEETEPLGGLFAV